MATKNDKTLEQELAELVNEGGGSGETVTINVPQPEPLKYEPPTQTPAAPQAPKTPGPYDELARILNEAFAQASTGKGRQRHAHSPVGLRPWHEQPILANARQVGPAGPAMQTMKKSQEAIAMASRGDYDSAIAEFYGAIVYAAATIKVLEEMKAVGMNTRPFGTAAE